MPRSLIVAYLFLLIPLFSKAQTYHYGTGKALGVNEANNIVWKKGIYNNYPAEFGTLIVKENRSERRSRLINVPIIKVKAIHPSDSLSPIFLLHGGPGESNLQTHLFFEGLIQSRDVVLVGYRGVDGTVKLNCPNLKETILSDSISLNNADSLIQQAALECISCLITEKIDINGYSMDEVIEDIEITRKILNYPKISFLAFSYGTMLAQLYVQRYDTLISEMVLIGARPIEKFLFNNEMLQDKLYKIYSNKFDEVNSDINRKDFKSLSVDALCDVINKGSGLNDFRLSLLLYSKLYTVSDADIIIKACKDLSNHNFGNIRELYSQFYMDFPSNVVFGDNYLKKQGMLYPDKGMKDTTKNALSKPINALYNPKISLLMKKDTTTNNISNNINTLMLVGEFDITSLYDKNDSYFPYYLNKKIVLLKETGHLDFFYSKKSETNRYIIDFFSNN